MEYDFNPARSYENGRQEGYKQGYAKGFAEARDKAIELFCDEVVMLLADEGWEEDQIQEFADRLSHGVQYYCNYPEDFEIKKRQVFNRYNITIRYDGEERGN